MKVHSQPSVVQNELLKNTETENTRPSSEIEHGSKAARQSGLDSYSVRLSDKVKDRQQAFTKALEIARQTPAERSERVAELRQQIASGTYQPDSEKIANGLLREAALEFLAEQEQ